MQVWPFLVPVKKEEVPDYNDVVKKPMDLQTLTDNIDRNKYSTKEEFESDLRLIFSNAKEYNTKGTTYYKCAVELEEAADRLLMNLKFDHNDISRDTDREEARDNPQKKVKVN